MKTHSFYVTKAKLNALFLFITIRTFCVIMLMVILGYIGEVIKDGFIGALMFIVSLLVIPESVALWILRRIKPDLVLRKSLIGRVREAFQLILNKEGFVLSSASGDAAKKRFDTIAGLTKERAVLEGNLFFLDLLKNLSSMLYFAVTQDGHDTDAALSILSNSLSYLNYYAKGLKDSETFRTENEDSGLAAQALESVINDAQSFLRSKPGQESLTVVQQTTKMGVARFDSYMKERYEATKHAYHATSQMLGELLIKHIEQDDE